MKEANTPSNQSVIGAMSVKSNLISSDKVI